MKKIRPKRFQTIDEKYQETQTLRKKDEHETIDD